MQIPSSVYTKYNEAMALFSDTDNFGVQCQLIFQKIVPLTPTPSDIRQRLTMNPQTGQAGMLRGTEATKVEETSEAITLRVYSDKKAFDKVGRFDFATGSCMTIGTAAQMSDLKRANFLVYESGRFERAGEVLTWGLNSSYCVAHWKK